MKFCKSPPDGRFRPCCCVRFPSVFPTGNLRQKYRAGEVGGFCNVFYRNDLDTASLCARVVAERGRGQEPCKV